MYKRQALAKEPAAREALHAAEASDWFWWFGDDHTSAEDLSLIHISEPTRPY